MSDLKIFSSDISVSGKRVIVRLDLNVPINNSKIDDDTRIKVIEPFVNKLIENKAKVILLSHLGRPKGKAVSELSLKPIFNYLEKKLNGKIYFYQEKIDSKALDASNKLKPGEVLLFENIRFFKEEEGDEETFAKNLSRLGDIYINEAFSCSHRKQASIHKITRFIDSYGGPLLEKEIQSIVENNTNELFNLTFVKSEVVCENFRFDSLCWDEENNSFVIIEYKNSKSSSVIDQGYSYLSIMLNKKSDFVLEYNENMDNMMNKELYETKKENNCQYKIKRKYG